jgi:5'-nucleotidase
MLFPGLAETPRYPILLVDIDDVCADFVGKLLRLYNADYHDCLTAEDLTEWDMTKAVKAECGFRIYDYFKRPGMFGGDDLALMPGAYGALSRLSGSCEIWAVSSVPRYAARDRAAWVRRKLPMVKGTVIASKKSSVWGDVLIDDKPENLHGGAFFGILMDRPHNRSYGGPEPRVFDWNQAEELINAFVLTAGPFISLTPRGWGYA